MAVAIKPYITTGVPELGIPAADPLILDEIAFDLKNPIIDVHVEFTDNAVTGTTNDVMFLMIYLLYYRTCSARTD